MKLTESGVVFDPIQHTYTLDGVQLSGITGMIKHQIFPDEYKDVPQAVLQKAAERGSNIHQLIELTDGGFPVKDVPEIESYKRIKKENKFITIANEYIVTDGKHFASGIDLVFAKSKTAKTVYLVDTKTTYVLNKEYVRWQLSVYCYLFELQNPKIKIGGIYALWLRGEKSEFVPLDRIDVPTVKRLLDAEVAGKQFVSEIEKSTKEYPVQIIQAERSLADLETQLKDLKEKKETLMAGLLPIMEANGIKSYKGQIIMLSRKDAYEKEFFDGKKFKEDHPDLYAEYVKTSTVKSSLTLKIL
jgi:hypothetical protein